MPAGQEAPLSYGQQRLWFLQQLYPDNPFYTYADLLEVDGPLDQDRVQAAYEQVVQRHKILHSSFQVHADRVIQRGVPDMQPVFRVYDLSEIAPEDQQVQAQEHCIAEARKPIDLQEGPMCRLILLRFSAQRHQLLLVMPHLITDNASYDIFLRELGIFYRGNPSEVSSLPALAIQYADFAYWQQHSKPKQKDIAYWKKKLAGSMPMLALPMDRPRPVMPSFKGAYQTEVLPDDIYQALISLSKQMNTTMFVLMLAAFKVLLHRYSNQREIVVGAPFSNRDQRALESMMGFFNETQALRTDIDPSMSFEEYVQQVRVTVLEAFEHKNTPFELLVRELNPQRQMSHNPLFQVMFLHKQGIETGNLDDQVSFRHPPFDLGVSKFDLTLAMLEEAGTLSSIFEYATDLFDASTIKRMQANYHCLLAEIIAQPQAKIGQLGILDEKERETLLSTWNPSRSQTPTDHPVAIHSLIERQVAAHPDAIALSHQGIYISYQVLNDRANAVASFLLEQSPSPANIVGICAEPGPEMIIAMIGVLKAGLAYLPIDPHYPKERIAFMLSDAGISLLLVEHRIRPLLELDTEELGVDMKSIDALAMRTDIGFASPLMSEDDLAYVIYTSGSSGRPKGVPISHKQLIHSTMARLSYYPETPSAFLLLSSFSFDSSVAGIYWTLCTGGKLVLSEKRIEQDMLRLSSLIAQEQVSHTLLLPSLYDLLLQHAGDTHLQSLRTVIVAGERCSPAVGRRHWETQPQIKLYNEYGPTEATVWATVHRIESTDTTSVPIGRPIPNTQVYVLDEQQNLVPIGVPGELYIGGPGVAGRYLNRPELSADRFVRNPIDPQSSYILYRTGDLVRYRPDGLLEFLGRTDEQIKIRGHRVELNEIAEWLRKQADVMEAAVIIGEPIKPSKQEDDSTVALLDQLSQMSPKDIEQLLASVEALSESEIALLLAQQTEMKRRT